MNRKSTMADVNTRNPSSPIQKFREMAERTVENIRSESDVGKEPRMAKTVREMISAGDSRPGL